MTRHGGSGKLEFLLVVLLFGILAATLLDRLISVEQSAERTEVDLTIRNIRVGLQLAVGERVMHGQDERIAELLTRNPVSFLGHHPVGYLGETTTPGGAGTWRFDPATRILSYRPRQPEAFDDRQELRWYMAAKTTLAGRMQGVRLENLE